MSLLGTVREWIEHLKRHYKPDDVIAAIVWQVDDILSRAKERKIEVTKEQAEEILRRLENHHDATLGITWETIDYRIDYRED